MINKEELTVEEIDILTGATILEEQGFTTEAHGFISILAEVCASRKELAMQRVFITQLQKDNETYQKRIRQLMRGNKGDGP